MKLKINGFENEILLNNENVNLIAIKDTKCFSHIIEIINNKINGIESNEIFLLDDDQNELNMNKKICMIFDLYNIEYNSKKVLTKIYDLIGENIKKSEDYLIDELTFKLRNYIIQEINELPFEFEMKDELDITEIFKLYNLKIDSSNYNSILERVEFLIDLISTLKIADILIIPNLKLYLSKEETIELYKYSLYNNINLIVIERNYDNKLKYEKVWLIDENFNDVLI